MAEAGTKRSEDFHRSERLLVDEANALLAEIKEWAKNHGALVESDESLWADGQGIKISKARAFVRLEGWTYQSLDTLDKKNGEMGRYRGLEVRTHCKETVHKLLRDPSDGWRRFKTERISMGASGSTEPLDEAIWERVSHIWGWFEALLNKAFTSTN
jgi:hypothetical protein